LIFDIVDSVGKSLNGQIVVVEQFFGPEDYGFQSILFPKTKIVASGLFLEF
jgi:hypothetical protein